MVRKMKKNRNKPSLFKNIFGCTKRQDSLDDGHNHRNAPSKPIFSTPLLGKDNDKRCLVETYIEEDRNSDRGKEDPSLLDDISFIKDDSGVFSDVVGSDMDMEIHSGDVGMYFQQETDSQNTPTLLELSELSNEKSELLKTIEDQIIPYVDNNPVKDTKSRIKTYGHYRDLKVRGPLLQLNEPKSFLARYEFKEHWFTQPFLPTNPFSRLTDNDAKPEDGQNMIKAVKQKDELKSVVLNEGILSEEKKHKLSRDKKPMVHFASKVETRELLESEECQSVKSPTPENYQPMKSLTPDSYQSCYSQSLSTSGMYQSSHAQAPPTSELCQSSHAQAPPTSELCQSSHAQAPPTSELCQSSHAQAPPTSELCQSSHAQAPPITEIQDGDLIDFHLYSETSTSLKTVVDSPPSGISKDKHLVGHQRAETLSLAINSSANFVSGSDPSLEPCLSPSSPVYPGLTRNLHPQRLQKSQSEMGLAQRPPIPDKDLDILKPLILKLIHVQNQSRKIGLYVLFC